MGRKEELLSAFSTFDVIDSHEHLLDIGKRDPEGDFFTEYLPDYADVDLITAGLAREDWDKLMDRSRGVIERWDLLEPHWERARLTGSVRYLEKTAQVLYGIPEISRETVELLDRCVRQGIAGNQYDTVYRKCNIKTALLNAHESFSCDRRYFTPIGSRTDEYYLHFYSYDQLLKIEALHGRPIRRLDQLVEAMEEEMYREAEMGAAGFKTAIATVHGLDIKDVSYAEADHAFNQVLSSRHAHLEPWGGRTTGSRGGALTDYMVHRMLETAGRLNLPVQLHTGITPGNGNYLPKTNPKLLQPLFLKYPEVNFVLFHMGFPYEHIMASLAKIYPNVYLDSVWAHMLSPKIMTRVLREWIEAVPYNKVFAFGGDAFCIDTVAGHWQLALENLATVLDGAVGDGWLTEKKALQIAKAMLHDNLVECYRLNV